MENNNNLPNAGEGTAKAERDGFKGNRHFNKNKNHKNFKNRSENRDGVKGEDNGTGSEKRHEKNSEKKFEKKHDRNSDKGFEKNNEKSGDRSFEKSFEKNYDKSHKHHNGHHSKDKIGAKNDRPERLDKSEGAARRDGYKKFDGRKKHKEYKRSENDINLIKAQSLVELEEELDKDVAEVEVEVAATQTVQESTMPQPALQKSAPVEASAPSTPEASEPAVNEEPKKQPPKKMINVIGVRFRQAGKIYYFAPGEFELKKGDHVIVETARGTEYGRVVLAPRMVEDMPNYHPMKTVIRIATPEDDEIEKNNRVKEKEAFDICSEKIKKHNLEMKLIDSEYTYDNNKLLFYFTADGRIDFRELVKDLASVFRTRIELRQVGVRDETKIVGGIGICGRPLCCHTYLADFSPVSIKMAKEQNLSLNPTKISGVCGRLMCCLSNEEAWYEEANSKLPDIGAGVTTFDGFSGVVHSVNVLKQKVRVIITLEDDEKEAREYSVEEIKFKKARKDNRFAMDDELRQLEMLEKKEVKSNLEDE